MAKTVKAVFYAPIKFLGRVIANTKLDNTTNAHFIIMKAGWNLKGEVGKPQGRR